MIEFFAMDGKAAFVWPSYLISAVVLIGLVILSWRRLRRAEREALALEREAG